MAKSDQISDEQLVAWYQNGHQDALKLLVRRHHQTLKRVVGLHTKDPTPVDDLVQECWYAIIPKLADIKLQVSFKAYVVTVARHKAIDWIRTKQAKRSYQMDESWQEQYELEPEQVHSSDLLLAAIHDLPDGQQVILRMFYLDQIKIAEIGKFLGISIGTVKSRLFYAREHLKSIIKDKPNY